MCLHACGLKFVHQYFSQPSAPQVESTAGEAEVAGLNQVTVPVNVRLHRADQLGDEAHAINGVGCAAR